MSYVSPTDIDFSRREEPQPTTDLRRLLEEWLGYQRHEFLRKLRDLTPEGLVDGRYLVELSVLGLVRHMTQMEHVYLSWGLGGGERVEVYGDDDYAGGSVKPPMTTWRPTWRRSRSQIASSPTFPRFSGCWARETAGGDADQDDRRVRPPRRSGAHAPLRFTRGDHPLIGVPSQLSPSVMPPRWLIVGSVAGLLTAIAVAVALERWHQYFWPGRVP